MPHVASVGWRGASSAFVRADPLFEEPDTEPDAEPDVEVLPHRRDPCGTIKFASDCLSDSVHLSADGMSAHHVSSYDEVMYGVVLSEGPLVETATGYYFELSVDAIQEGKTGGLVLGVTTTHPADLESMVPGLPEAAVEVPFCWCIGFYGAAYSSAPGLGNFTDVPWDPQLLRLGDHVGLHLTADGVMSVVQNGAVVAQSPDVVPTDCVLYAVVDLLGKTAGVSIVPDAVAPCASREPALSNSVAMAGGTPGSRSTRSGSSWSRSILPVRRNAGRSQMTFQAPSCATMRRHSAVGGFKPDRPVPPRPSVRRASVLIPDSTPQGTSTRPSCGYMNVHVASAGSRSMTRRSPAEVTDDVDECSICLEQLTEPQRFDCSVRCLPCLHSFHRNCINNWLQHNSTCPVCRSDIN